VAVSSRTPTGWALPTAALLAPEEIRADALQARRGVIALRRLPCTLGMQHGSFGLMPLALLVFLLLKESKLSRCAKGPAGADRTPPRLYSEAHTPISPLAGGLRPMLGQQHYPGGNVMSTGPDDQIKHPDSLTGTSEADTPDAPILGDDSDVHDEAALRDQDEDGPVDEDA
jgi:hypothetical protein